MTSEHSGATICPCCLWAQVDKKYSIVVEGNKATASVGSERVAVVTAMVGTDEASVQINPGGPATISNMKIKALQKFTDSNLAAELRNTCLFILMEKEMAQAAPEVGAESN